MPGECLVIKLDNGASIVSSKPKGTLWEKPAAEEFVKDVLSEKRLKDKMVIAYAFATGSELNEYCRSSRLASIDDLLVGPYSDVPVRSQLFLPEGRKETELGPNENVVYVEKGNRDGNRTATE